MWPDVIDMRDFYKTSLGHVARRMLTKKLRQLCPEVKNYNVLALGYPTPFLQTYRKEAQRLVAIMPAEQGALSWSRSKTPNIVTLADETKLPLADKSIDFAFLVHALEFSPESRDLLREVWRVIADGGRLIVIVPNRRGVWARTDRTPFGQGHPFSPFQLNKLLRDNMFTPIRHEHALYIPPTYSRILLSTALAWEKIGNKWFRNLSGVFFVEASKQIFASALQEKTEWTEKLKLPKRLVTNIKS